MALLQQTCLPLVACGLMLIQSLLRTQMSLRTRVEKHCLKPKPLKLKHKSLNCNPKPNSF